MKIRDLDRIRERTPVYLEPLHLALGTASLVALVAAVFVGGYFLGRGGVDETTRPPDLVPVATADGPAPATLRKNGPPGGATRGQVLPPPLEIPTRSNESPVVMERRGQDVLPLPAAPPQEPQDAAPVARPAIPVAPSTSEPAVAALPPAPPPSVPSTPPVPIVAPVAPASPVSQPASDGDWYWPGVMVTDLAGCMSCVVADGACRTPDLPVPAEPERPPPGSPVAKDPVPDATDAPKAPPKPGATWAVQARAFRDEAGAREYVTALKSRGYTARVVPFKDPSGTAWFRIRLGRFQTLLAAQSFAAKFNLREHETAIAVEVP